MPFKSRKQERYLQINEPEIYRDWVEEYGHFSAESLCIVCNDKPVDKSQPNSMGVTCNTPKCVHYLHSAESFSAEECGECGHRMAPKWVEYVCNCGHTEMNPSSISCTNCGGGELEPKWIEYVCGCGNTKGPTDFWSAESFGAYRSSYKPKKLKRVRQNSAFPSGTSLQGYIKTNRTELRKAFGKPNMGASDDGKVKSSSWNLIIDGKVCTIYDRREQGKRGMKYFNIGGRDMFSPLLVAQELSKKRGEQVNAHETVPKWNEEKRFHERVNSIGEHPIITYDRAMRYYNNQSRYRAESLVLSRHRGLGPLSPDAQCVALLWLKNPLHAKDAEGNPVVMRKTRCNSKRYKDEEYCWLHRKEIPTDALGKEMRVHYAESFSAEFAAEASYCSNFNDHQWIPFGSEEMSCDKCDAIVTPETIKLASEDMFADLDGITRDEKGMRHSPHKKCPDCGAKPTSSWIDPGKCECGRVMNPSEYTNIRFSAELKRDSCCCGATKSKPCACMIQGVMECNATCPCSLEKSAETFSAEMSHADKGMRIWEMVQQNLNNPLAVEGFYATFFGEDTEYYDGMDSAVIEAVKDLSKNPEWTDELFKEYGLDNCYWCGEDSKTTKYLPFDEGEYAYWCKECYEDSEGEKWDAESFNSYKVAPDLSSYTKAELVSSIAGPQGTAAYQEVVYDPIAQSRMSAETATQRFKDYGNSLAGDSVCPACGSEDWDESFEDEGRGYCGCGHEFSVDSAAANPLLTFYELEALKEQGTLTSDQKEYLEWTITSTLRELDSSSYTKQHIQDELVAHGWTLNRWGNAEPPKESASTLVVNAEGIDSFSPTRLMVLGASIGVALGLYKTRGD